MMNINFFPLWAQRKEAKERAPLPYFTIPLYIYGVWPAVTIIGKGITIADTLLMYCFPSHAEFSKQNQTPMLRINANRIKT